MYNLLKTPWLPVRRRSGERQKVRPWEITDRIDEDPIVALDVPRADFNGSLVQWLIGLLQTVNCPESGRAWEKLYIDPPSPEILRELCHPWLEAFNLGGDGPRVLQDQGISDQADKPISGLLIEEPGDNTLKENRDLFIKRNQFPALGLTAAISALITLQMSAPSGGAGHRTSLRGGGPLTSLVVPDPLSSAYEPNLWRLVWSNVLDQRMADRMTGNRQLDRFEEIFPWMGATRTSERGSGVATTPEDAHPFQMYWSTPRRILLDLEDAEPGICPMTFEREPLIKRYKTRNYGVNYEGPWQHPLSPHQVNKDGLPLPRHPQPDGLGYRHWLALTLGGDDSGNLPAMVVQAQHTSRQRRKYPMRLWAFGFDMDNMKARGWYEAQMPLYYIDEDHRTLFAYHVQGLLECAETIAGNLRYSLKKAWFSDRRTISGDLNFITRAFWSNTETQFYAELENIRGELGLGNEIPDFSNWLSSVERESLRLFDERVSSASIEHEDPHRVANARKNLERSNRSGKVKKRLGLADKAS